MLRTFDHAGYYETRLILMAISLAVAGYFAYYKRDNRFLVMFASGAFFMTLTEYLLQMTGFRGPGYSFSIFGAVMPGAIGPILQGVLEGGACGLIAFWFADLRTSRANTKRWTPFYAICALAAVLSFVAGYVSRARPVSSVRPMFAGQSILFVTGIIFVSLFIAWRMDALSPIANFFGGLLLFTIINYEPLHIMGSRYIGVGSGLTAAAASTAPPIAQIGMMLLSHVFELAGGKLHYFMIPFALGLVALREKDDGKLRERYSTQHLQDLAQRGWRKRSKPFQR